jgi:hypothetical protein
MIDAEAEKDLRDLGFTIPIAVSIVRQINDYVAYHTSKAANSEDPGPTGNEGGGRRSRKGKKQRRRTRRRN